MKKQNSPLDTKIISIFFLLSFFSYFSVDTIEIHIYGLSFSGYLAEILWAIVYIFCLICSYGLWVRKIFLWKIILGYAIFFLGDIVFKFFFTFSDKMHSKNWYSDTDFFFILFFFIDFFFIFYLFKRKKIFYK